MPSKHIEQILWDAVEEETVKAVKSTSMPINSTEMLRYLLVKGLISVDMNEIVLLRKLSGPTINQAIAKGKLPEDRDTSQ